MRISGTWAAAWEVCVPGDKSRKRRVDFRPNRQRPRRQKHWEVPVDADQLAQDAPAQESVRAKGDLSRRRTVTDNADPALSAPVSDGNVIAVRGRFVEVLDGRRVWLCTVRRILRTVRIEDRSPVVVGDRVSFAVVNNSETGADGVIVNVYPRRTVLKRSDGRRTHAIAANVDQVLILNSIQEPRLKEHLLDRYLVAAHAGGLPAIICITKIDLDEYDEAEEVLQRFRQIGYVALGVSSLTGQGIEELRALMKDKVTLLAGQSGVGKSSLLNTLQPGLNLPTAEVSVSTQKGRHTTTTAVSYPLDFGVAVDTPGIRALEVAMVPLQELEMHFVEFVDRLAKCRFPDCIHIHEQDCAIKRAVEAGEIDPVRYESYVELFMELSETRRRDNTGG
jgi:ribosome biogenesis GTPase / thiamine phosphate phosphatase